MSACRGLSIATLTLLSAVMLPAIVWPAQSLKASNEVLLGDLQRVHGLSDGQVNGLRELFARSGYIGQGNPAITEHPLTPAG